MLIWARGIGSCLIPIRYTHVVSRHRSIRVQMTWWKTCAISACISQGHIPCLPSTPKTAFGRKSCCVCVCACVCSESERAIPALAPGRSLPTCHFSRRRMELCQRTRCTQYSLETGRRVEWVASSLLGGCWLIREDNFVSCFLLSVSEGVDLFHQIWIHGSVLPIL